MAELKELIKPYERLALALKGIEKAASNESKQIILIDSALSGIGALEPDALKLGLETLRADAAQKLDRAVSARRQELEAKARDTGFTYRRLSSSDTVGVFKVEYVGRKVKLFLGSELLTSFEETSGLKVLERITAEQQRLDNLLLPRDRFIKVMKTAIAMGRAEGLAANGKVKIRDLFPFVAVSRQLASEVFRKKPLAKSYVDYGLAELGYELHRFGEHSDGWSCNGQRIHNTGPAMASQHEALMLPDAIGNPTQVLWVWIE